VRYLLAAFVALFLFPLASCASPESQYEKAASMPEAFTKALAAPDKVTLLSLTFTGLNTSDSFYGTKILGQADLLGALAQQATQEFQQAVERGGQQALCMNPRHGLRVVAHDKTYDFVLCYECGYMQMYQDSVHIKTVGISGDSGLLNHLLTEAGVPVAD